MGKRLHLREQRPSDLAELIADLRPLDRQEVEAASGAGWTSNIARALDVSDMALAATTEEGDLAALFGVVPTGLLTGSGQIWMLGTNKIIPYRRSLGLISRRYIAETSRCYRQLWNYVDARNAPSIRYLRWLGFTIEPARPFGAGGLPFHRFEMRSDQPACAAPPQQAPSPS